MGQLDAGMFHPGPMACFLDQWLTRRTGYSLMEIDMFRMVHKNELLARSKGFKPLSRRGKRVPAGTRLFFNNSRALAQLAIERQKQENTDVVAVLFRDSDDAPGTGPDHWWNKRESMLNGFKREDYLYGVPMIPKPVSEAWILCALRQYYQHCESLELESGRPGAKNSLKKQLYAHLGHNPTRELLIQLIEGGKLNMKRINMPSMRAFKARCDEIMDILGWFPAADE